MDRQATETQDDPQITYRPFHPDDAEACRAVIMSNVDGFGGVPPEAREKMRAHFTAKSQREHLTAIYCIVAPAQGRVVGLGGLAGDEVRRRYVLPECQGRGIGRTIYDMVEAEGRRRGLKKLRLYAVPNAVGFYQAVGCVKASDIVWDLDGSCIQAVLMVKVLR